MLSTHVRKIIQPVKLDLQFDTDLIELKLAVSRQRREWNLKVLRYLFTVHPSGEA